MPHCTGYNYKSSEVDFILKGTRDHLRRAVVLGNNNNNNEDQKHACSVLYNTIFVSSRRLHKGGIKHEGVRIFSYSETSNVIVLLSYTVGVRS